MSDGKHPLIDKAIGVVGSQEKLAEAMTREGCPSSQSSVSRMLLRETDVSAEAAKAIDKATNGTVPRWKLRPDLWDKPAPHPPSKDAAA
jgi:DNA-binding transcriptional regulator YdaS (Cro superfamily)